MSLRAETVDGLRFSFPRVSGDEPGGKCLCGAHATFSPRERG